MSRAVFSVLDIVPARLDMRIRFLRVISWSLTAATIYLDVSGEHGLYKPGELVPVGIEDVLEDGPSCENEETHP